MKETISPEIKKYPSPPEEAILESLDITKSSPLRGGINVIALLELKNDGKALFKYRDIDNREELDRMKCERACYLTDLFLKFNLIPPTVIRTIEEKKHWFMGEMYYGTAQQYVENALTGAEVKRKKENWPMEEVVKMDIFDYIVNNHDRHNGNWLIKDGKIYGIDNEFTFTYDSRLPPQFHLDEHGTLGLVVPEETKKRLNEFVTNQEVRGVLRELLSELILQEHIDQMFRRAEGINKIIMENGAVSSKDIDFLESII